MELHAHSQRREALLFLITNMAAATSSANRQSVQVFKRLCRSNVYISPNEDFANLRTADAFSVVASLPPKDAIFRRERSDDRKCVCCLQAKILPVVGRNDRIVYKVCLCKRTCILLLRIDSNSSLDMRGTWVTRSISSLPTLLSPGTFPA